VCVGRDSWVGIATRYGLDGQGIESRWGRDFRTRPDRPWGLPSRLYNGYRVSLPGVKRPGRGANHPPSSSAEVKERIELYLYFPSGPSWPVLGRTLLFISVCMRAWVRAGGCEGMDAEVCLRACSPTYPACNTPSYCHLLPLWLYHIFRNYLINGRIFGKKLLNLKCVFGFLYNVC
jgi:hypothetical protein